MTYRELLHEGKEQLLKAGIPDAEEDARALLLFQMKWSMTDYLMQADHEASPDNISALRNFFEKRAARVPLQHITHIAPFMGYDFAVDERVLVPRFDTEILAETVIRTEKKRLKQGAQEKGRLLDLCTGSGCLAVSLSKTGLFRAVDASDISEGALELAALNAQNLHENVHFYHSDLFDALTETYDVIVSNPPYIRTEEIGTLDPEVKDHDPLAALDGGADGLIFYRRIAAEAKKHLTKGGRLYLEIGDDQGEAVSRIFCESGYQDVTVIKDLTERDRVVICLTD